MKKTLKFDTEPTRCISFELPSVGASLEMSCKNEPDLCARRGLDDDIFRTSIGLEAPDDLIADLEKGLAARRAAMD